MHSTTQTAPPTSEITIETASTSDAWIRQRKQPLRPQKSSTKLLPLVTHAFDSANNSCSLRNLQRNCFHWLRMHSTVQTARSASEIFNETASTRDAWIRQRKQPLQPQKSSTKLLPLVTHAFDIANSSCSLRNLQRNCFHG
jgi:IS4 transposase